MAYPQFDPPIGRRLLESALAVLVIASTISLFAAPATLVDVPSIVGSLWFGAIFALPLALSASVLLGALAHGVRLGSSLLGTTERVRPGDASPGRILASLAFGWLAAVTLWFVGGTIYVLVFGGTGGVLLGPIFGSITASVLGALVLARAALTRLFPEGLAVRLRRPTLE